MMATQIFYFADIGNSRIKIAKCRANNLDEAVSDSQRWNIQVMPVDSFDLASFDMAGDWYICSVNQNATERLEKQLQDTPSTLKVLNYADLKIETELESPETTGIDRLCAAIAANQLRDPEHAAIVVDSGTAVTIDLINQDGVFLGGVIFPGISTSLKSLRRDTSALPEIEWTDKVESSKIIGRNTSEAIWRGVYWSHRGAIESIVTRISDQCDTSIDLFVTGGNGKDLCQDFSRQQWHPSLVLQGVALATANL